MLHAALVLIQILLATHPRRANPWHARTARLTRPHIRWTLNQGSGRGSGRLPGDKGGRRGGESLPPLLVDFEGRAFDSLSFDSEGRRERLEARRFVMAEGFDGGVDDGGVGSMIGDLDGAPYVRPPVTVRKLQPSQVLEVHSNGSQRQMRTDYASILQQLQLSVRDLRMLRSHAAEIVVHQNRIVYDVGDLKGVIFNNRVVLLEAQREAARSLHRSIKKHVQQINGRAASTTASTFALSVFEVVLEETTSGFEHSFLRLETAIKSVLPTLTDPSAKEGGRMTALSRMLPLENALSSLRLRVRRVNAILEQLLESTDDIEGLCELSSGNSTCTEGEYALTEIAIEAYSSRLEFLGDQIDSLTDFIGTARNSLEIALDSERNRMARLELYASMLSLPLAGIGAVAGIFGMNLRSGVEEATRMFGIVTGLTLVISFAAFGVCWRRYHESTVSQGRQVLDAQRAPCVIPPPTHTHRR